MAAPRKHPPSNALEEIERLAGKGHSTTGLAKHFKVARSTIARWLEEDERLEEAYEQGRDSYRQWLEEQIVAMTLAGKTPVGFLYLLKAKFKMYDQPSSNQKIDVKVENQPQPVLVVKDYGTDEEWAAKAAEQQRRLVSGEPLTIPARLSAPETSAEPIAEALPFTAPARLPAPLNAPAWKPPALP